MRLTTTATHYHVTVAGDSTQKGGGIGTSLGWEDVASPTNQ